MIFLALHKGLLAHPVRSSATFTIINTSKKIILVYVGRVHTGLILDNVHVHVY